MQHGGLTEVSLYALCEAFLVRSFICQFCVSVECCAILVDDALTAVTAVLRVNKSIILGSRTCCPVVSVCFIVTSQLSPQTTNEGRLSVVNDALSRDCKPRD